MVRRSATVAAALTLGVSACAGGGPSATTGSPSPSATAALSGAVFAMHASFHGAITTAGDYTVLLPDETCAGRSQATADKSAYDVPDDSGATVAGYELSVDVSISGDRFHGPGTYSRADLDPGSGAVDLGPDIEVEPTDQKATAAITVAGDGSGTFSFEGWTDGSGNTLGGAISWHCQDHGKSSPPAAEPS